ncbi:MAG: hypothetical protein J0L89_11150 [Xanthomonadales bacterium]|nr:hypothetical protein [Xanthomonadales bacterium]
MNNHDHGPATAGNAATHPPLHAWLSVLCGAGCGLVLWLALSSTLLPDTTATVRRLIELQARGLGLGALLAMAGLGVLLPRPPAAGAWWNRSVAALVVVAVGSAVLALHRLGPQPDPVWLALLAAVTCVGALTAIVGLALLETGQPRLRLPLRLAQALLGGATLLFALFALRWPAGSGLAAGPVPSLALLVVAVAGLLLAMWHGQGGLRPWRHRRGRWLALALAAGLPLLLAGLLYLQPGWARVLWPLIALSVLAGTATERLQSR